MLLVRTKVRYSRRNKITGVGLLAAQYIPAKTLVWKFDNRFDMFFDPKQVESLPEIQREMIKDGGYMSYHTNAYVCSIDNSRFINSSKKPNIDNTQVMPGDTEICWIATKDIYEGEELTTSSINTKNT